MRVLLAHFFFVLEEKKLTDDEKTFNLFLS